VIIEASEEHLSHPSEPWWVAPCWIGVAAVTIGGWYVLGVVARLVWRWVTAVLVITRIA